MVRVNKHIIKRKIFILLLLVNALLLISCTPPDLYKQILDFCENNKELKLSEITDFEWDIAYVDRQYYKSGEEIKEKYNIEGEFKRLRTDFSSRVAFCKDGKLVYDLELNNHYFEFESSVDIISPESVFTVTWIPDPDPEPGYDEDKLFLSLKIDPQYTALPPSSLTLENAPPSDCPLKSRQYKCTLQWQQYP